MIPYEFPGFREAFRRPVCPAREPRTGRDADPRPIEPRSAPQAPRGAARASRARGQSISGATPAGACDRETTPQSCRAGPVRATGSQRGKMARLSQASRVDDARACTPTGGGIAAGRRLSSEGLSAAISLGPEHVEARLRLKYMSPRLVGEVPRPLEDPWSRSDI
jgi:hypothetical protein